MPKNDSQNLNLHWNFYFNGMECHSHRQPAKFWFRVVRLLNLKTTYYNNRLFDYFLSIFKKGPSFTPPMLNLHFYLAIFSFFYEVQVSIEFKEDKKFRYGKLFIKEKKCSQFKKNLEIQKIKIAGWHAMNRLVIDLEKNKIVLHN